jgi:hypothetical protein
VAGKSEEQNDFKEKRGHWWVSRVLVPIFVGGVALGGLLYVNRDKTPSDDTAEHTGRLEETQAGVGGGWGPLRDMYTVQEASPTAAFNSILDQPEVGDERNFVRCKIADDKDMMYPDRLRLIPPRCVPA